MKNILLITISLSILSVGCKTPRLGTETYIKNSIEEHTPTQFSEIQTFTIFQGPVTGVKKKGGGYLELVGYNYKNEKKLVISSDKTGIKKKMFKEDQGTTSFKGKTIYYNTISLKDCRTLVEKYEELIEKGKSSLDRRKLNNTLYFDYTISENLYISIEHVNKSSTGYRMYIHIWLNGQKFSLSSRKIIPKINKFINWEVK